MGCQNTDATTRPVTLKLSTWGSAEEITQLKSLIGEFEDTHPQVQVELLHIPDNYFQKLHILVAGDLTPDVMFVNSLSFAEYAEYGILMPLDERLDKPGSDISKTTFHEAALKALSWKHHVYGIPRDISDLAVFVNTDLFRQAGISLPPSGWTMTDLVSKGQALTKDTDGDGSRDQFGFSFYPKPPLFWLPFVWSNGGHLYGDDYIDQFLLTEPKAVEALQFYADLRNKWHIAPTQQEVGSANPSQLFLQGKLAMLLSGRWTVPVLRDQAKFKWDVIPFPKGKVGSVVGIDASGYTIAKKTPHPEESWQLVSFLSSHKAQSLFAQSGLIVPARIDTSHDKAFLADHGQVFLDAIPTGQPTHVPVAWNEMAEDLGLALTPVWEGTTTAKAAMDSVAPKIQEVLSWEE
jgi:multiple sugar transport system substrate-binding protein